MGGRGGIVVQGPVPGKCVFCLVILSACYHCHRGGTPALFYGDERSATVCRATIFISTLDCLDCVRATCVKPVDIPDVAEVVKQLSILFF